MNTSDTPRRRLVLTLLAMLLGVVLFSVLAQWGKGFDPQHAALGLNTVARVSSYEGVAVSTHDVSAGTIQRSFRELRGRGVKIGLWLGASQLHGVNRFEPGDEVAVFYANQHASARRAPLRYLQVSLPNGNNNEFLGIYLELRDEGLIPDWLLLGATYDDLREPGVRGPVLARLPPIDDALVQIGGAGIANLRVEQLQTDAHLPVARTATSGTPQDRLEDFLQKGLARIWGSYGYRDKLQARVIFELRALLSRSMGALLERVTPPIPEDIRRWNEAAFDSLLRLAQRDGVRVLVYKPPHPQYAGRFYHDRKDYDAFHAAVRAQSEAAGFAYVDLETLVPVEFWGLTNEGRPDTHHFTAEGHRRLGRRIDEELSRLSARSGE